MDVIHKNKGLLCAHISPTSTILWFFIQHFQRCISRLSMDRHEKVKQLRIDVHQSYKIALNMFKFISYFCNNLSVQFAVACKFV